MDDHAIVFSPVSDFFSEAFDSHYCAGLRYTAHPDNPRLRAAATEWAKQGKVTLLPTGGGTQPARMGGLGSIGR